MEATVALLICGLPETQSHTSNHHTDQITQATHSHGKHPDTCNPCLNAQMKAENTHTHTLVCAASERSNCGDLQFCPTAKQTNQV